MGISNLWRKLWMPAKKKPIRRKAKYVTLGWETLEERVVPTHTGFGGIERGNLAWFYNDDDLNIPSVGSSNATFIDTTSWGGVIDYMEVHLVGLFHTWPDDLDVLFGSANLGYIQLMSDAGGSTDIGVNLIFVPNAYSTNTVPDNGPIVTGAYRGSIYGENEGWNSDLFGSIIDSDGYRNDSASQNWRLVINDDAAGDSGRLNWWKLVLSTKPYNVSAGGPYTVYEGGTVYQDAAPQNMYLAGSASDREQSSTSLAYYWDLDNNGSYGDIAEARTPTVTWATLNSLYQNQGGIGLGQKFIRVQAHDGYGSDVSQVSLIDVRDEDNTAPTVTLGGSTGTQSHMADQKFTWSATDTQSGIFATNVQLTRNGAPVPGFTSTAASGTFDFNSLLYDPNYGPGTYQISVSATDNDYDNNRAGDRKTSETFTRTVVVTNAPPVAYAGLNKTVKEGQLVSFNGGGSSDADSETLDYAWDFGDGFSGTGATPTHAYADNGTYHVTLTVIDQLNVTSSHSLDVTVLNLAPVITGLSNTGPVLVGEPVTVTVDASDAAGDALIYEFDFDNDGVYEVSNGTGFASHTYATENIFPVNVRVNDGDGIQVTSWTAVEVGTPAAVTPTVTFATADQTVGEEAGSVTVTATLDQATTASVLVPILLGGSAQAGVDFTLPFTYLLIPAGETAATISIAVTDDASDEYVEDLVLTMGPPVNALPGAITTHTILIDDNDDPPQVSFFADARSVAEDAGAITVRARVSQVSGKEIRIPLTITGTADSPEDFTLPTGTEIVIPAGSSIGAITINIIDDALAESNQTIILSMGAPTNAEASTLAGSPATQVITIPQNDAPSLSLSPAYRQVSENDGVLTITGTLSNPHALPVDASLAITGSVDSSDYSNAPTILHFNVGQTTATATIQIVNDTLAEGNEDLVIYLTGATNARLGATRNTVFEIAVNDTPTVSFTTAQQSEFEDANFVAVTATLSNVSNQDVFVPLNFSGSAGASDYTPLATSIFIPAGAPSGSIILQILNDQATESRETINVTMGTPENANKGVITGMTIAIDDDEPTVSFQSSSSVNEDAGTYHLTAVLSSPTNKPVTIPLTSYGSATLGVDYSFESLQIFIPAGQTSGSVDVSINNDNLVESAEAFSLHMGAVQNAVLGATTVQTVDIIDDDKVTLTFVGGPITVTEAPGVHSTVTITWRLSAPLAEAVDVPLFVSSNDGFSLSGDDNPGNFNPDSIRFLGGSTLAIGGNSTTEGTFQAKVSNGGSPRPASQGQIQSGRTSNPDFSSQGTLVLSSRPLNNETPSAPDDRVVYEDDEGEPISWSLPGWVFDVRDDVNEFLYDTGKTILKAFGWDGYISGGTAFFDANKNGALDFVDYNLDGIQDPNEPSEPVATTAVDGGFILAIPMAFDRNRDQRFDAEEGQLVVVGGVDTATQLPLTGALIAPAEFFVASPVTTLVANLVNTQGLNPTDALARTIQALGLPTVDLRNFDPIQETLAGNINAALVFAAEAKLQDTITQIASLVSNMADAPPTAVAAELVMADLAAKIAAPGSQLNLSNSFMVQSVIEGVLDRAGLVMDAALVTGAATVISAGNAHIDDLPLTSDLAFLTQVVQTQVVALGTVAGQLADLADGATAAEIQALIAQNTGLELENQISVAEVGNIVPIGIHVSDATIVEQHSGETVMEFTVSLDGTPAGPVSVSYATKNSSATAGSDYTATSGALSWAAGDASSRTIQVHVLGDTVFEPNERFYLQLSNAIGGIPNAIAVTGTIVNDDPFNYVAPEEGAVNKLELWLSENGIEFDRNDVSVFAGELSSADPITITGAATIPNWLTINMTSPGVMLPGPLHFQGGNTTGDSLTIKDDLALEVTHTITGSESGTLVIDGMFVSYAGVESVSDSIAPTIIVPATPLFEGGGEIVLGSSVDDPEITYSYLWTVTGETGVIASGATSELQFTPADSGAFSVQLRTSAPGRGTGITMLTLAVANVAPAFEAGGDETILPPVAGAFARSGITFSDPGPDVWTGSVNFGDASGDITLVIDQQNKTFDLGHTFTASGIFRVSVTINDDDGGSTTDSFDVTVILNTPPIANDDSTSTDEDHAVAFNVLAYDTDEQNNIVATLTIALSEPSAGVLTNNGDGTFTFDPNSAFEYLAVDESTTVSFDYQVFDTFGYSDIGTATITITGANDGPAITVTNNSVTVDEGQAASNTGAFFDVDLSDRPTITASIGTITQDTSNSGNWSWSFDASDGPNESQTVTITATDSDNAFATTTFSLVVNNVAPTVTLTGPDSAYEGQTKSYSFTTSDPGDDTFSIVATSGGSVGTVSNVVFSSATGAGSFEVTFSDGPITSTVSIQLKDSDEATSNISTIDVAVGNVAPTATANSYTGSQGFDVSGNVLTDGTVDSDPAAANDPLTVTGYTQPANGTVTVNADGTFTYIPATTFSGTDSFTYTISDGDGGGATATVTLFVNAPTGGSITTVADICMGGTALLINGTTVGDQIVVEPGSTSSTLKVTINGAITTVAKPSGRIIVMGGAGNDNIQIAGAISNSVWLYGDSGDDRLNAGNASQGGNLLFGGDDNDELLGGSGRDIMIGGQGADKLTGNANDDILIAGLTSYDSRSAAGHEDFWCRVMHEWTDTSVAFTARVDKLRYGTGATGANLMANVIDDDTADQIDMLQGSSGNDWFIFKAGEDKVVGQTEASN